MSREAALLFKIDHGIFPALEANIDFVDEGARHEDQKDHIWDHGGFYVTCTHFWDADSSDLSENYDFVGGVTCANAFMKSNELLDDLFEGYLANNWYQVWERLGHIAHLIGDMTVPAHAHVDYHVSFDSYDDGWIGWDDNGASPQNYRQFTAYDAYDEGGIVLVPQGAIDWIINDHEQNGGYGLAYNWTTYAQLYYLMYTSAQTADYFASDDYDGGTGDRHGWMDYTGWPSSPITTDDLDDNWWYDAGEVAWVFTNYDGDYTRIGQTAFVYGIRDVAGLYLAVRDALDPEPPTTTIQLTYTETPNQGWTKGDVTMTLEAEDNFEDAPFGVYKTYWSKGFDVPEYTYPITFTEEGIYNIEYWSVDNFGNIEPRNTETILIDKTGPSINVVSPLANGFYLTSGTLTVEWEASDELSGVLSEFADIDGVPVAQGEILDLDDMGGWHILTIYVSDVAGNVTIKTVEFSVKIHATVDFKPDKLNVKSSSDVVIVYIEFPSGYDVALIDLSTARLEPQMGWFLHAVPSPTETDDYDRDDVLDRMVQFSKQDTIFALGDTTGFVLIKVFGELEDNTEYYGTEIIEVTNPGEKH
jgi:hypothetical protein